MNRAVAPKGWEGLSESSAWPRPRQISPQAQAGSRRQLGRYPIEEATTRRMRGICPGPEGLGKERGRMRGVATACHLGIPLWGPRRRGPFHPHSLSLPRGSRGRLQETRLPGPGAAAPGVAIYFAAVCWPCRARHDGPQGNAPFAQHFQDMIFALQKYVVGSRVASFCKTYI